MALVACWFWPSGVHAAGPAVPVAAPASFQVEAGRSLTIDLLATSSDADGDELEVTLLTSPTGQMTQLGLGVWRYTAPAFATSSTFTYRVSDGASSDDATVAIEVVPAPPALPAPASNPSPADGATGVAIRPALEWTGDAGAQAYWVYLGTNPAAMSQVGSGILTSHQVAFNLALATTYYWRVDTGNGAGGVTVGPTWRFTTTASLPGLISPASSPSPSHGAAGQLIVLTLSWAKGANVTTQELYFGEGGLSSFPVVTDILGNSQLAVGLQYGKTYFWKVVSNGPGNQRVDGPVWSFQTAPAPSGLPGAPSNPSAGLGIDYGYPPAGLEPTLSWTPGAGAVSHMVIFGGYNALSLPMTIVQDGTATSWQPASPLVAAGRYCWQVVERGSNPVALTVGPRWCFRVADTADIRALAQSPWASTLEEGTEVDVLPDNLLTSLPPASAGADNRWNVEDLSACSGANAPPCKVWRSVRSSENSPFLNFVVARLAPSQMYAVKVRYVVDTRASVPASAAGIEIGSLPDPAAMLRLDRDTLGYTTLGTAAGGLEIREVVTGLGTADANGFFQFFISDDTLSQQAMLAGVYLAPVVRRTVNAVADTWVQEAVCPGTYLGHGSELTLTLSQNLGGSSDWRIGYLRFDTAAAIGSGRLQGQQLRLTMASTAQSLWIFGIDPSDPNAGWVESTAHFCNTSRNTVPPPNGRPVAHRTGLNAQTYFFDVSAVPLAPNRQQVFGLTVDDGSSLVYVRSRESGQGAKLELWITP